MRVLDTDVVDAQPFANNGCLLRIKTRSGEEFGIELSSLAAVSLGQSITAALQPKVEVSSQPKEPEPEPEPPAKKPAKAFSFEAAPAQDHAESDAPDASQ